MTSKLQTLIKKTNSTRELMKELVDSGITSVNEALQGTKLFSSLIASNARELELDETHYLLIPLPESPANYAIFTKRVLPPGIGNLNNLPKARIFHVPEPDGKPILEEELIKHYMTPLLDSDASSPDFATTLEDLAARIDSETSRISGGLIIIGGVVAFLNPLLGVGIASNALLPAVGAKATKAGADYVGQKLRRFQRESTENKARKSAQKEVKKLKPQIFANPILRSLDVIFSNPASDYDPFSDESTWPDSFSPYHFYPLSIEAVQEVYVEILSSMQNDAYPLNHLNWINSLMEVNLSDFER